MIKNFRQNLVDFRGVILIDKNAAGEEEQVSLHTVAVNSLLATDQEDMRLSGMDKVKRFTLAQKIYVKPEEVELTDEELKLIKDLIGKHSLVIVAGCAWELLDKE